MFLSDLGDMSALTWIMVIGAGLLIGWFIATKRNNNTADQVIFLKAEEFRANMRKGQLIDIRKEDQYSEGKILGSRNFPNRDILQNLFKLRSDQAVFLYSNSDSGIINSVAKKLVKKGFKPVYILIGGMDQWPFIVKK